MPTTGTETIGLELGGSFPQDAARAAAEADRLAASLTKVGAAAPKATIGQAAIGARSPWASGKPPPAAAVSPTIYRAIGAYKLEQEAAEKARKAKEKASAAGGTKDAIGTVAGGAKMAVGAGLAKIGFSSAGGLAELAMGYKGMAQLNALTLRGSLQFRQLFKGIDSSPVVRAYDRFLRSFDTTSVAGNAMAGAFSRIFGGAFSFIERAQPAATAFFQGMLLGALYAENAWLRLRVALLPVTGALEEAVGPMGAVNTAAGAGLIAFGALAIAVGGVGGAFVAMGAAIGAALEQWRQLKAEWDWDALSKKKDRDKGAADFEEWAKANNAASAARAAGQQKVGAMGRPAPGGAAAPVTGSATPMAPASAVPTGVATGKDLAAGVAQGLGQGEGAVKAAAEGLVKVADGSMRAASQTHSPSEMTKRFGRDLGAGVPLGMDQQRGAVQAAAERSLVPRLPSGGGSPGGTVAQAGGERVIRLVVDFAGNVPAPARAGFVSTLTEDLRAVAQSMGVPVALGGT